VLDRVIRCATSSLGISKGALDVSHDRFHLLHGPDSVGKNKLDFRFREIWLDAVVVGSAAHCEDNEAGELAKPRLIGVVNTRAEIKTVSRIRSNARSIPLESCESAGFPNASFMAKPPTKPGKRPTIEFSTY